MDKINTWTDTYLDAMRLEGDPLADDFVGFLYKKGHVSKFNEIIRIIQYNQQTLPSGLGTRLGSYLIKSSRFPDWFDEDAYHRGSIMFLKYELPIMATLLFVALPMSYAAAKGAYVLTHTYRLVNNPHRRALETIQLLRDLMEPNGLNSEGRGLSSIMKVRLLHASTRYLLTKDGEWDVDYYGIPINQEDLAGTHLLFTYIVITSLPHLNIEMTEQEIADYLHCWKFFSYLLGINVDLLPDTIEEAQFLTEKIRKRHFKHSEDGVRLTHTLADMISEHLPVSKATHNIPLGIMRYLCGDEVADILGIEKTLWYDMLRPFHWFESFFHDHRLFQQMALKAIDVMFKGMYEAQVLHQIDRKRATYSLPINLTKSWKLDEKE